MTAFYAITYCSDEEYDPFGVAYAPPEVDTFLLPMSGQHVDSWEPINLELRDGGYADYLSNDLGGRLCSEDLMRVIDSLKSESDIINWLVVNVFSGNVNRKYYLLHFPENFPVVDERKSIMAGDMVVKAVLDAEVTRYHRVFTFPNSDGRMFFVSNEVKLAIDENGFTGISFIKALTNS